MIERLDFVRSFSIAQSPDRKITQFSMTPLRLLENGNLPRVIERVLRHSMQHEVKIVSLPRYALAQPRLWQPRNRLHQPVMRVLHISESLMPRGLGGLGNHGKIRRARELHRLPA
jgi:hypothetical protein